MPVVPAVYSTTVPPGGRRPSASAAVIAASAIRSFILPVGFADSSFASTRAEPAGTILRSSMSGVLPMPDSTPGAFVSVLRMKAGRAVVVSMRRRRCGRSSLRQRRRCSHGTVAQELIEEREHVDHYLLHIVLAIDVIAFVGISLVAI